MTWTPYAVGVAALLAVCVAATVARWILAAYLARLERELERRQRPPRRSYPPTPREQLLRELRREIARAPEDPARGAPYSWGSDLDLFARLTLDEIRALPETREPAA